MNKIAALLGLSILSFIQVPSALAASLPGSDIVDVESYLNDSTYFNGHNEITAFDFTGKWRYTAIAYESGNENTVSINAGPGIHTWNPQWNPEDAEFTTYSDGNFGQWATIDFSTEELFFEDYYPNNIYLDPFSSASSAFFRVFELTNDSNNLAYLGANALSLTAQTIIVGFNDNGLSGGDADYDDIIVALQRVSDVPIPAALWLFAPALLGFMGLRKKTS